MPREKKDIVCLLRENWSLIVGITVIILNMSTSMKNSNEALILSKRNEAEINTLKIWQAEMKVDLEYIKKSTTIIENVLTKSYAQYSK